MTERQSIATRLARILAQLESTASSSGRDPKAVVLLPVTKTRSESEVGVLYDLGLRNFGENRVSEIVRKIPLFPVDCGWEMIGHLQSNKAADCIGVTRVHSLDSESAVRALEKAFAKHARTVKVLLEVNSGEDQKHGLNSFDQLRHLRDVVEDCPHLVLEGLMTMAPFVQDEATLRSAFAKAWKWREGLLSDRPGRELPVLSMGMSNDFEWAVREGSTLVRIGTALFEEPL